VSWNTHPGKNSCCLNKVKWTNPGKGAVGSLKQC